MFALGKSLWIALAAALVAPAAGLAAFIILADWDHAEPPARVSFIGASFVSASELMILVTGHGLWLRSAPLQTEKNIPHSDKS